MSKRHVTLRCVAIAAVSLSLGCWLFGRLPSDGLLIDYFGKHRAELDGLVGMLHEDHAISWISLTTVEFDDGARSMLDECVRIGPERRESYRRLLRSLHLATGVAIRPGEEIILWVSSKGLVTGGSGKGLAYRPDPPERVVESLDGMESSSRRGTAYRKIDDRWYVFLYWD